MQDKVYAFVEKLNMIQDKDKVIVGISGGADSVCLLFVLLELRKRIPFSITAVHVNHRIRVEADADAAFVRELCEEYEIPCHFYEYDVKAIAEKEHLSEEESGRKVRREAFEQTMRETGANKIALAHHQNDNAETLLLNLARGTGLQGLCGILPINGPYIRPLLCVSRDEIERFLAGKRISYCTDSTNESDAYARNRIRNRVIPYLEQEINPAVVCHIDRTIGQIRSAWEYMEGQKHIYEEQCVKSSELGYIVNKDAFCEVPEVLQAFIIKDVLTKAAGQAKDIEAVHLQLVQELMDRQVGRKLDLPYDISATRTYEGVRIEKKGTFESKIVPHMLEPKMGKDISVYMAGKRITYSLLQKGKEPDQEMENSGIKTFDYDIIKGSLMLRTRESGDTIFLGPGGTQKLKSFFVNQKVPQKQREETLLLAEGSQILWVDGFRTDMRYRVTENTKNILRIQIEKGEK